LGRIIPTDELIFFRGVGSTTNQIGYDEKTMFRWETGSVTLMTFLKNQHPAATTHRGQ
jgi:hypothetical protein